MAYPRRIPAEGYQITVERIAEKLRNARPAGAKATLLIGAGCSVTAGIPACAELIRRIRDDFPYAYEAAKERCATGDPDYGRCMAVLDSRERRALIEGYVREANVNWAHLAIACLMRAGYVDRVLTTNFDNLVIRAAALLGIFPGVYDMTLYRQDAEDRDAPLLWDALPAHAVFHLHGQSIGFQLLNTPEDLARHAPHVGDCFRFGEAARPWIVVGYGGENDPIFQTHIEPTRRFGRSLHWVGFRDEGVPEEVYDALFTKDKQATYVPGLDADLFFIRLAQKLEVFPPELLSDPLRHLRATMDVFTPFPEPGTDAKADVLGEAKTLIERAIERMGPGPTEADPLAGPPPGDGPAVAASGVNLFAQAAILRMKGDHRGVVDLYDATPPEGRAALRDLAASAYFQLGYEAAERAARGPVETRPEGLRVASDFYRRAVDLRPDFPEAENNWGNALGDLAAIVPEGERRALLAEAIAHVRRAVELRPDDPEAHGNWGVALAMFARLVPEGERRALLEEAIGHYRRAVELRPDDPEAHGNWGAALGELGAISPEGERRALFAETFVRYRRAVELRPDLPEAESNWGNALGDLAAIAPEGERRALFAEAFAHRRRAVELRPDYPVAHDGWATTLLQRAGLVPESEDERRATLSDADDAARRAERLSPGAGAYNLACIAALRDDPEECERWLRAALRHGTLPGEAHLLADADLASVRDAPWFRAFLGEAYPDA